MIRWLQECDCSVRRESDVHMICNTPRGICEWAVRNSLWMNCLQNEHRPKLPFWFKRVFTNKRNERLVAIVSFTHISHIHPENISHPTHPPRGLKRIQWSQSFSSAGAPGRLMTSSWVPDDLSFTSWFNFTAVSIRRKFFSFLQVRKKHQMKCLGLGLVACLLQRVKSSRIYLW